VRDVVSSPEYLDVSLRAGKSFSHPTPRGHTVFAYVIGGKGVFCRQKDPFSYEVDGENDFGEPIAWRGPIVMNTQEELRIAFEELDQGTFIKTR
jgi:redox-sensitive bicupin YhaK (pirin superfamily)